MSLGRQRGPIAPCAPARQVLVRRLRAAVDAAELSYSQLAREVGYHPASVSRVLSGRSASTWRLIERIAARCGVPIDTAQALAENAGIDCSEGRLQGGIGGYPPADLAAYQPFLDALRHVPAWAGLSQREVVRRDSTGLLCRSTVGAVLRGERSASREVTIAIVRACGVSEAAVAAWAVAWHRAGQPFRDAMEQQRRQIAYHRLTGGRRWGGWW